RRGVPSVAAKVIERPPGGPAVVRLPGEVGALKDEVGLTAVSNDEHNVGFSFRVERSQLPEIDPADPILRDRKCDGRSPVALDESVRAVRGSWWWLACERSFAEHEASAFAAVVAKTIEVDLKLRSRVSADVDRESFARLDAGL